MLGISTALRSEICDNGREIIAAILDLGLNRVELEYRIDEAMLKQILPFWKREEIFVTSVHNFLPSPDGIPREKAVPDFFSLSSTDEEERKYALKYSRRTIEWAEELGASTVVLHLGKIPVENDPMAKLKKFYDEKKIQTPEGKTYIEEQKGIRTKKGVPHVQAALRSLDLLAREAERRKVFLGLECRYNLYDFPNIEEFQILFKEFSGGPLRYWHDIGHATAQQNLGLIHAEDLLENFGPLLAGTHLHGCRGYEDHEAPGTGDEDYAVLKKYLQPQTLRILEVHHRATREELLRGIEFLRKQGIS
jgi:sugar phosphate isomerase/epimerase